MQAWLVKTKRPQGKRQRGNRSREAIEVDDYSFWKKRSCVCQSRWQLVKKIRACYYCFQHHFRLIKPPTSTQNTDKHTHTHTHTYTLLSQNFKCFLSFLPKNKANARPCVTLICSPQNKFDEIQTSCCCASPSQ